MRKPLLYLVAAAAGLGVVLYLLEVFFSGGASPVPPEPTPQAAAPASPTAVGSVAPAPSGPSVAKPSPAVPAPFRCEPAQPKPPAPPAVPEPAPVEVQPPAPKPPAPVPAPVEAAPTAPKRAPVAARPAEPQPPTEGRPKTLPGNRAGAVWDGLAVWQKVKPRVCLVRVDGALGLPVSYASGFLLGSVRMVVTDLASVAQPGVTQVTVIFDDGTQVVAKEFGLADPALGVVAISVDLPKDKTAGLTLSKASVPEDGISAAVAGWKWGESLGMIASTLKGRAAGGELAEKMALDAPAPEVEFLRFRSPSLDIATGAAVVDADGQVAGVMVRIMGAANPLVAPAPLIRQALLSGGSQLKPLSALPNALWPVSLQVTPGQPPTSGEFAAAARLVRRHSICTTCKGKGTIIVKKFLGYRKGSLGNRVRVYREVPETCGQCRGEGVVCGRGLYNQFMRMAEGAAHLIASPDTTENVRDAAFKNGMGLLEALTKVPAGYRDSLTSQIRADLGAADPKYPRGAILYARVCESVNLRGDDFTVLVPYGSATVLMVNSEMLTSAYGVDNNPAAATPTFGASVVVGGVLEGEADLQGARPILMRPFGWSFGPALGSVTSRRPFVNDPPTGLPGAVAAAPPPTVSGPAAPPAARITTTRTTRRRPKTFVVKRPTRQPGEPSFFGL